MDLLTVVQARTQSTRLPGKVLLKLGGKTILEHILERLAMCEQDIGTVIVATGAHSWNSPIADVCRAVGVPCFRGAEDDVVHRFQMAVMSYDAESVIRVTADCPLLDPRLVDLLVEGQRGDITRITGTPKGIGEEELITSEALYRLWADSCGDEREHVTTHANGNKDFTITYLQADDYLFDHRHLRLVLDTPEDWELLRELYAATDGRLFELGSRDIIGVACTLQQAA